MWDRRIPDLWDSGHPYDPETTSTITTNTNHQLRDDVASEQIGCLAMNDA